MCQSLLFLVVSVTFGRSCYKKSGKAHGGHLGEAEGAGGKGLSAHRVITMMEKGLTFGKGGRGSSTEGGIRTQSNYAVEGGTQGPGSTRGSKVGDDCALPQGTGDRDVEGQ